MVVEAETAAAGVDALYAIVKVKAAVVMPIKTQFYGMREFGIEDPDGYVIYVAQRVAGSAPGTVLAVGIRCGGQGDEERCARTGM